MSQKDSPGAQRESNEGECDDKDDGEAKTGQGRREGEPRARRCVLRGETACLGKVEGSEARILEDQPSLDSQAEKELCSGALEPAKKPDHQSSCCRPPVAGHDSTTRPPRNNNRKPPGASSQGTDAPWPAAHQYKATRRREENDGGCAAVKLQSRGRK